MKKFEKTRKILLNDQEEFNSDEKLILRRMNCMNFDEEFNLIKNLDENRKNRFVNLYLGD